MFKILINQEAKKKKRERHTRAAFGCDTLTCDVISQTRRKLSVFVGCLWKCLASVDWH